MITWIVNQWFETPWCCHSRFSRYAAKIVPDSILRPVIVSQKPARESPARSLTLGGRPSTVSSAKPTVRNPTSSALTQHPTTYLTGMMCAGLTERRFTMAVPKRKMSRSNTASRRSQWKATAPTLVKTMENGKVVYSLPHRAKVVEDSAGTPLYMEYKGRKVADI